MRRWEGNWFWSKSARIHKLARKSLKWCGVFRGKIIDVAPKSLIVEVTGNDNKIKAFLSLLESFGVSELARTGTVSLAQRPAR